MARKSSYIKGAEERAKERAARDGQQRNYDKYMEDELIRKTAARLGSTGKAAGSCEGSPRGEAAQGGGVTTGKP